MVVNEQRQYEASSEYMKDVAECLEDANIDPTRLEKIITHIQTQITIGHIHVSGALPQLEKIAAHKNISPEVLKSLLYIINLSGDSNTESLLKVIKNNERAMSFMHVLSVYGTDGYDRRAYGINYVALKILRK